MASHIKQGDWIDTKLIGGPFPRTRFALVDQDGLHELAEASPDRIDDVIRFFGGDYTAEQNTGGFGVRDVVIYAGQRAIAVLTHEDGQPARVRRLDLAPEVPADAD